MRLLVSHDRSMVLSFPLNNQRFAVVPDRNRSNEHEADVLHTRFVHLIFRADNRRRYPISLGKIHGRMSSGNLRPGCLNVRAAQSAS